MPSVPSATGRFRPVLPGWRGFKASEKGVGTMNSDKPLILGSFACETGLHLPSRMWFMPN